MSHPGREGLAPTRPQPGAWHQICRSSLRMKPGHGPALTPAKTGGTHRSQVETHSLSPC